MEVIFAARGSSLLKRSSSSAVARVSSASRSASHRDLFAGLVVLGRARRVRLPGTRPSTKLACTPGGHASPACPPHVPLDLGGLQDPAYLAGMLAGGLTTSDTIGVVGAMPIPEVDRIVKGVDGVNPTATVKVSFINSFFDPGSRQSASVQVMSVRQVAGSGSSPGPLR